MVDTISPEKRSWNMSRIKDRDTSIEVRVRKYLYHQGYRYRKNVSSLPGKPDIVMEAYKTIIFIHGCFWHRHTNCKKATIPKTRTDFWLNKFDKNVANDTKNREKLESMGYKVIVIWECEINKSFLETVQKISSLVGPPHRNHTHTDKE